MATKRVVALLGAVLIALAALPSFALGGPSGFVGAIGSTSNQKPGGLASPAPTPDSGGGTVVANVTLEPAPSSSDPVLLGMILVAIAGVGVQVALFVWRERKAARPPRQKVP